MEGEEISISNKPSKSINSLTKSLSILVVDDDTTCLSIVAAILKSWNYQVVTMKHPNDALKALKIKENSFDLVITDVHMPDMDGFELQKQINQDFHLPVVLMSADDQDLIMIKGLQNGASFFITKPVSPNDLRHLWQYAYANKKGKVVIEELEATQETPKHEKPYDEYTLIPKTISQIGNEASNKEMELKMKSATREDIKDVCTTNRKKKKFIWTKSLHNLFLEALRSLGFEDAVPKKLLEIMDVPGLTRDHIASHLQKFRLFIKKVTQKGSEVQYGRLQLDSVPGLGSSSLSKLSLGGYFPISKSPKLGLQSAFNRRQQFGGDISNLLYNGNNSKQSMFGSSKSIYDANNFVFRNKPNIPFYGDCSKRVIMGQEKPQITQYGIEKGLNIGIPRLENIGSFNNQNFNYYQNFKGSAKLGTFGNKKLDSDMRSFGKIGAFSNQNLNFHPNFRGSPKLGSFGNKQLNTDMPSFEKIGAFNNPNFNFNPEFKGSAKLDIFGNKQLDIDGPSFEKIGSFNNQNFNIRPNFVNNWLSGSTSSVSGYKPNIPFYGDLSKKVVIGQEKPQIARRSIENGLHTDMPSFEKIGPFNNQNFNFGPNFGNKWPEGLTSFVSGNEFMKGIGNENMSTIPVSTKLGDSSMIIENQPILEVTPQHQDDNNGGDDMAIFGGWNDLSDSGSNYFSQQFGDQVDASFAQSQTQIPQSGGSEEIIPDFAIAASPSVDQLFEPFNQNS